jgi:AraC-like DNA-binding protein
LWVARADDLVARESAAESLSIGHGSGRSRARRRGLDAAEIALACGYFDPAHPIREFRAFCVDWYVATVR